MKGNRTKRYYFRADEDEELLIETKFKNSGLASRSDYLRRMALGGYIITANCETFDNLTRVMSKTSNNVNQIALVANRSGRIYKEDLDEIKKELHEIWQLLNFIKSKIQKIEQSHML